MSKTFLRPPKPSVKLTAEPAATKEPAAAVDAEPSSPSTVKSQGQILESIVDQEDDDQADAGDESDDNDFAEIGEAEEAVIRIHEPKCLQCAHLVAFAEKYYKGCHHSAGNERCPAKAAVIVVQINTDKIVKKFLRAEAEGDTKELERFYAKLGTKKAWIQKQIMDAIKHEREAKA